MNAQMLLQSFAGGDEEKTYIEDVFSTYLYTGNDSTQTINNGIDLAGEGGLVWIKSRSSAMYPNHWLWDTERTIGGNPAYLHTNNANAQGDGVTNNITAWLNNGFIYGTSIACNESGQSYTSWTFRRAPKFFDVVTYTGDGVAGRQIPHNLGVAPGMVVVKRTNASGGWVVWHKGFSANGHMYLHGTGAFTPSTTVWGTHSESSITLGADSEVNANGDTYVAYLFAHDPSADGMIQCGSFTTDASGNAAVNWGWEPQHVMLKKSSGVGDYYVLDQMRGFAASPATNNRFLISNSSVAEASIGAGINPSATGFSVTGAFASSTVIYLAIRRGPMRVPTDGTKVFKPIARTGTSNDFTYSNVGFTPDFLLSSWRTAANVYHECLDKLRGTTKYLVASQTYAEINTTPPKDALEWTMDGLKVGTNQNGTLNVNAQPEINHFFRRAPGFFDVVCDTGTGAAHAINHSLTVAPELIIRKSRSSATQWECWHSALSATEKLVLNSTAAKTTDATAFGTRPTATQLYVGTSANTNTSAATYVTYLFATCPGVSKVFSYIGNGSSQTINCGFSGGARFVLIKASSATGSWWIYDTARGIVSSADPALQLNSTVAEISTADAIDPDPSGFIVNQEASCSINANGVSYVGLAIS